MDWPPELVAAIRAVPDDPEGYLVLGDWLQEHGDRHGELVALMRDAEEREDETHKHKIARLRRELSPPGERHWLDWRWGFVRRARFAQGSTLDELRAVLRSPLASFLRELVFEVPEQAWIETAAELAPPTVRSLELHHAAFAPAYDPGALWRRFPELDRLYVRAAQPLRPGELPRARELWIGTFSPSQMSALHDLAGPAVETLRISLFNEPYRDDLFDFLVPERFPRLRELVLVESTFPRISHGMLTTQELLALPIAPQLEVLELFSNTGELLVTPPVRSYVIDRRPRLAGDAGLLVVAADAPLAGRLVTLPPAGWYTIGRTHELPLHLGRGASAEHHAEVGHDRGAWRLRCYAPTQLHGVTVAETELHDGDEITIGRHVLRFLAGDLDARAARYRAHRGLPG